MSSTADKTTGSTRTPYGGRSVGMGGQFEYRRMSSMELEMIPLQKAVGASKAPQDTQTLRATKDRRDLQVLAAEGDVDKLKRAMENDREGVIFIPGERKKNANGQDEEGNTPLHSAVIKRQLAVIQFLASHDDVSFLVKNDNQETALHVAVKSGDIEILETILLNRGKGPLKSVDVPGPNGKTPLYFAVQAGQFKMVKQLINNKANPLIADQDSYTPIGVAALKGNLKLLELFFSEAESGLHEDWGIEDVIESMDNGSLLHLAVESGSVEVVQFVLEKKLDINAKKSDGSTALHLACANGQLNIVTILVDALIDMSYPEGLVAKDEQGLIPLHRATVFDRRDVVEHLLDKGGDIEALTKEGMTPVLLAAQHGADNTATLLLQRGADPNARISDGSTVLHKAVGNARTLQTITKALDENLPKLINLQDMKGYTALHSAAEAGYVQAVSFLLEKGARVDVTDSSLDLPLHLAAREGHLLVVLNLVNKEPKQINEINIQGSTALHLASHQGHVNVVDYLLQRGAKCSNDHTGRTPMHFACESGSSGCLEMLIVQFPDAINSVDSNQDSALHLAAKHDHSRLVAMLLDREAEIKSNNDEQNVLDMALQTPGVSGVLLTLTEHRRWHEMMKPHGAEDRSQLQLLVEKKPEAAVKILNNCITTENPPDAPNHKEIYNVTYLQGITDKTHTVTTDQSLAVLKTMAEMKCEMCLRHKLCVEFLNVKWRKLGWTVYMINLLVYSIFVVLLTYYVFDFPRFPNTSDGNCFRDIPIRYIIMVFSVVNLLKETGQLVSERLRYFLHLTNIIEWTLYISTLVFMDPIQLFEPSETGGNNSNNLTETKTCPGRVWEIGAIAIFFAWMNMVLFWRRFSKFGLYVVMISTMVVTLLKVIIVVLLLVIAYGLVFLLLLRNQPAFHDIGVSLMKVFTMTLGDFEYTSVLPAPGEDNPDESEAVYFPELSYFLFVCFALSMIIIVSNLLIGLAVGDIGAVQRGATMERLTMQVNMISEIEKTVPKFLLKYLRHIIFNEIVTHPNHKPTLRKWFIGYFVDNVSVEDAEEEAEETDEDMRKTKNETDTLMERTKSLALRMDRQMDLLKSLTGSLAKSQGVITGDSTLPEDELEPDEEEDMDIDIATFVTRAAAGNRGPIVQTGPARHINWGTENDYV